ncbi:MAG: RDD family protein [Rhizobacter sp.]
MSAEHRLSLDTLYTAETPEGIALSLRPAGVAPRALAYMVDLCVRFGVFIGVSIFAIPFGGMGQGLLLVGYFLLEWFYPVFFELGRKGATPGKRMFGLTVVMDSGLPVTPAAAITRNLLRAADFIPVGYASGLLSMLLRRDFKRLGDLAAGTLVVYADDVALHGALPDAPATAPARPLAPHEQAAIVAWAGRASRLTPARLDELAVLARSVTPGGGGDATRKLLGVAQWLVGNRSDAHRGGKP